jgi:hypothetical protein
MGAVSDKDGERFYQNISQTEKTYNGKKGIQVYWLTAAGVLPMRHQLVKMKGERKRSECLINIFYSGYCI